MPYCMILQCKNNSSKQNIAHGGISYHRFPKDPLQKGRWIDATGRRNWMPTKTSTICSVHFCQEDIIVSEKGNRYIKDMAVPSKNIYIYVNQSDSVMHNKNQEVPGPAKKRTTDSMAGITSPKRPRENENTPPGSNFSTPRKQKLSAMIPVHGSDVILDGKAQEERRPAKKRTRDYTTDMASPKRSRGNENTLPLSNFLTPQIQKFSDLLTAQDSDVIPDMQHQEERGPAKNLTRAYMTDITNPKQSLRNETTWPGSNFLSPREQKLSGMLRWSQQKIRKQKLKIKRLQTQSSRLKRKLVNVEDILKDLREKFAMTSEHITTLKNLNVQVQDLIERQIGNVKENVVSKKKYTPALHSFALTLNYYSPKAYEYVRRVFNTSLPHRRTLQKWYSKIGGDPGFTKEAFSAIKLKADSTTSQLVGTLVIDEMSIRRRIEWDGRRLHGYVDMGTGLEGDHLSEAKEALVFLITAINSNFKVPVGFFLVDGVSGVQRADLVKQCLELAHNAGIKIVALTFDGCAANISMAGHLGCCIQNHDIKFDHPVTHEPVVSVLDPCHMIKLIRNAFENYQIFLDSDQNKIEWKYLEILNDLQYSETFHLANKLKDRHINFKNERMKVKLATQLFSRSVAEAMQFCRQSLQLESFRHSEATEKFLMIFNDIFDIFNSKNLHQYGYKKALNTNNAPYVFQCCDAAGRYIATLRLTDGTLAIKSLRKTGFLGFMNCIEALKHLYASLIETKILTCLPFYKLSQDHLELFFCNVRSHGGSNNNPTARQFIAAYKKMLVHVQLKDTNTGNCTALEQLSILNCSSAEERINRTSGLNYADENDEEINLDQNDDLDYPDYDFSEFTQNAIGHIAGYIVMKMIKSLRCDECVNALISPKNTSLHKFIMIKDKGGLQYPSKDVIQICQVSEKFIKSLEGTNIKKDLLMTKIVSQFIGSNIFDAIANHQLGEFPSSNHVTDLIKAIVERYLNVRIHHMLKLKVRTSKRQLLNKYVLFQGQ